MRLILAATLGLVCAGAVQAAPLCRDSKGLFTPCPPGMGSKTADRRKRPRVASSPEASARTGDQVAAAKPDAPTKPAIIRKAKLCRDSKGLFKPC
jgi:hypothetical protein